MVPPLINYVDRNSILIVNPGGQMRQLFVPFKVFVLSDTNILKKNNWVLVEEVVSNEQHKMLYRVTSNWWPYYLFKIQINF